MLTAEELDRFRQIGLRLDREGRFWHQGVEVTHLGLRRALLRWLDRLPDGRAIVRLDASRYAYVDVADADLLAVSARWEGARCFVRLNDDSEEELAYATLARGGDHALYARVRGGRLTARLTTPAYYVVAERIREADAGFVLAAAGQEFAIG